MYIHELQKALELSQVGKEMYRFIAELYPICRSITGNGVRETLRKVGGHIPLEIHEVPTGTQVFDWTIPKEWNIKEEIMAQMGHIREWGGRFIVLIPEVMVAP